MNRHDMEEKLLDMLEEVVKVYHDYNRDGQYLSMSYGVYDGKPYVSINNSYWHGGDDENIVIVARRDLKEEKAV